MISVMRTKATVEVRRWPAVCVYCYDEVEEEWIARTNDAIVSVKVTHPQVVGARGPEPPAIRVVDGTGVCIAESDNVVGAVAAGDLVSVRVHPAPISQARGIGHFAVIRFPSENFARAFQGFVNHHVLLMHNLQTAANMTTTG